MDVYKKKYLDVDVLALLEEKMHDNTKHYKGDFKIDKKLIKKAAASDRKEDKSLLWMSRESGTQCVKENDAFIKDSPGYSTWTYYENHSDDPIVACVVEVSGARDGVIFGNVYEVDYDAHVAVVKEKAVTACEYIKSFEDGYEEMVPVERSSYGYFASLVEVHGPVVDSLMTAKDKDELSQVLYEHKTERNKAKFTEFVPLTDIPVYRKTGEYARESGEVEEYRSSLKAGLKCKAAIEEAISENYKDNCLDDAGAKDVIRRFGSERVEFVLASTVQQYSWDGRFSLDNMSWAKKIDVCSENNYRFALSGPHPGLINLFIDQARKEISSLENTKGEKHLPLDKVIAATIRDEALKGHPRGKDNNREDFAAR